MKNKNNIDVKYKFEKSYPIYEEYNKLKDELLYKRIVKWDKNKLQLEDGTILSIVETEYECCASAHGEFKDVVLDAIITNVSEPKITNVPDWDTTVKTSIVTIYHNQNPIAIADCYADAGNGGYYYSICSFVVSKDDTENIYKIVKA